MSSKPQDSHDVRESVLWEEFRSSKSAAALDSLLEYYAPLVDERVEALARPRSTRVLLDAMADVCRNALIHAVRSFDPSHGVTFDAYCRERIDAAIRKTLREFAPPGGVLADDVQRHTFLMATGRGVRRTAETRRVASLLRRTKRTLEQIESALAEMHLQPDAGRLAVPKVPQLLQSEIDRLIDKGTESGLSEDEQAQLDEALDYLDDLTIYELERGRAADE